MKRVSEFRLSSSCIDPWRAGSRCASRRRKSRASMISTVFSVRTRGAALENPHRCRIAQKDAVLAEIQTVDTESSSKEEKNTSDDKIVECFKSMRDVLVGRGRSRTSPAAEELKLWEKLKEMALDDLENTTSFRISNILHWCKKGNYYDRELIGSLLNYARSKPEIMEGYYFVGISMTLQSLGMLARHAKQKGLKSEDKFLETDVVGFTQDLMDVIIRKGLLEGPKCTPMELSNALHGAGLVVSFCRFPKGSSILQSFTHYILSNFVAQAERASLADYTNLLHGCVHSAYRDKNHLQIVTSCVSDRLSQPDIKPTELELAGIIWALGKLHVYDEVLMGSLTPFVVSTRFNQENLSRLVHGYGLLKYNRLPVMQYFSKNLTQPKFLKEVTNQNLARVIYGLGYLKYQDSKSLSVLGQEVVSTHRIGKFNNRDFGSILFGFSEGMLRNMSIIRKLGDEMTKPERLESFGATSLVSSMFSLSGLGLFDAKILDELGMELIKPHRLEVLPPNLITKALFSLKWSSYSNVEVVNTIAREVIKEEQLRQFKSKDLVSIISSLGYLSPISEEIWIVLGDEVMKDSRMADMTNDDLYKIHKGFEASGFKRAGVTDVLKETLFGNPQAQ